MGEEVLALKVERGEPWEEAAVVTPGSSSLEEAAVVLLERRFDSAVQEEQTPSAPLRKAEGLRSDFVNDLP